MELLFISAFAVGISTIIGALIGLLFKNVSQYINDCITGFAAGVMLSAAIIGLIIPSTSYVEKHEIYLIVIGVLLGAFTLTLIDKLTPHLHNLTGLKEEKHESKQALDKILLFIIAIAIHNFPEGIAAGIGFGGNDINSAIMVAIGITIQNIPEGMIVITPLLINGVSKKKAFIIASVTAIVEVIGTFVGFYLTSLASVVLPFFLAFAGGTMLYVISDEMIPQSHSNGNERAATYSLIIGFILLVVIDFLLV